ncbi:hypothetical protein [Nocardia sp. CA-290969]|uniref:hypothetical protein n=1 Tax=Nocardia sp. CA-290969 TaxID=3239986 RepID=UPI003D8C4CEB
MPDQQFRTRDQVTQYLTQVFSPDRQHTILETEYGWVCRPVLTQQEIAQGQDLGLGNYVVNKVSGVVTAHRSLPPDLIGQEYDQAIRAGQPVQGAQIYPPMWDIQITLTRETATEVEYRVQARSLTQPQAEQSIDQQLTIDKQTLRTRTDTRIIHSASRHAVSWAEWRSRQDGTWPQSGTFQY